MIEQLLETFARHEELAPESGPVRRRIDAVVTRRRRLRQGFVGGTAVVLVTLFALAYMRLDAVSTAPRVGASGTASGAVTARGPVTFLIVGTDRRPWEPDGNGELLRADTIMLAHLPADRSAPYLISISRDQMVPFRGAQERLSFAFANEGARGLRHAVQSLTGIPVDGAVEVDFAGLIKVTDAVGGVELCVPRRGVSEHTGRIFEPGCRRFTGADAMDYLRQRKPWAYGDFSRQQNVREYVKALFKQLSQAGVPELLNLIRAGGAAVRVDAGAFQLPALIGAVRDAKAGLVTIETPADFDDTTPAATRFKPEAGELWTAVRDGKLPDWVAANPKQVDQR